MIKEVLLDRVKYRRSTAYETGSPEREVFNEEIFVTIVDSDAGIGNVAGSGRCR